MCIKVWIVLFHNNIKASGNYYGVKTGTEKYNAITERNMIKHLKLAFGVENLAGTDLTEEAEAAAYVVVRGDSLWLVAKNRLVSTADGQKFMI